MMAVCRLLLIVIIERLLAGSSGHHVFQHALNANVNSKAFHEGFDISDHLLDQFEPNGCVE
jgi:hypothetical protein